MKIDVFNHFTPKAVYERFKSIAPDNPGLKAFGAVPALWDLDAHLKLMEGFDDYRQILSLANPPIELLATPDRSPQLAAFANDALAAVCEKHRDLFPAFAASMPMNNPDATIKEAHGDVRFAAHYGLNSDIARVRKVPKSDIDSITIRPLRWRGS
jgi:hypothetical protein